MRIAILTNEFPPHIYGGAGVHVDFLSKELAAMDGGRHLLKVLCFGEQEESEGNLTVQGVKVDFTFPFQEPRNRRLLETLLRNVLMTGTLQEVDIIHCHTWYTHLAGCLLQQLLGKPLVLTTHSLEPHRPWKEEQLGSGYRVSTWMERTAYENADGVIAVSRSMQDDVHELYGVPLEKVRVIYNGVDVEKYKPTVNPEVLARYGIDPDKPYILFVGRITHQKGIMHLLRAVEHLIQGVQVVLCATDPDTVELGREVDQQIRGAEDPGRPHHHPCFQFCAHRRHHPPLQPGRHFRLSFHLRTLRDHQPGSHGLRHPGGGHGGGRHQGGGGPPGNRAPGAV